MSEFKMKAAQLDLARQMESVEFLRSFIDLLADNGYNTLKLYLEDRIRTVSYPYPAESESYSEEEIRSLVAYAAGKGIELFPGVSTLGHAERFLRHKEMSELSEVQDGMLDRFGNPSVKNAFCINHPRFYSFLENYLSEVAALFPSPYFHAGLDEFWNFNLCPRCRSVMHSFRDEENAFLQHVIRVRDILAKSGKRMMMCSDMFEFYPDVLSEVPRDVILDDWQYQEDVRRYTGHLLDQAQEDRAAYNEKAGFETLFTCADRTLGNAPSYLHYASRYKGMGYLLSCWEKTDTFLYRSYPHFCTLGRMLNGKSFETAFAESAEYLFGTDDITLRETLRMALSIGFTRHFAELADGTLFARPFAGRKLAAESSNSALLSIWRTLESRITTETGKRIWLDISLALREKETGFRLNRIFQELSDFGYTPSLADEAEKVYSDMEKLLDDLAAAWERFRPEIGPNLFAAKKEGLLKKLRGNLNLLPVRSLVRTRFCLPDAFGIPYVKIEVHTETGWQTVVPRASCKCGTSTALYEYTRIAGFHGTPDRVRYEVSGMGGQGICFSEVHDAQGNSYRPCAVEAVKGTVEHPEYLLADDANFAWFGNQSTRLGYNELTVMNQKHTVTLLLKRV